MDSKDRIHGGISRLMLRRVFVTAVVALLCWAAPSAVLASTASRVADVVGTPITHQSFDHWMFVAAKSGSAGSATTHVIVPTDPPRFSACIRQVRKQIPGLRREPAAELRLDCHTLFVALRDEVMDFLIKAHWYEDRARHDHIAPSDAKVRNVFETQKRRAFRTKAQFTQFLRQTGQTVGDIVFRIRISLSYGALLKDEHLTPGALEAEAERLFKAKTTCARFYVMSDCARG